MGRFLGPAALGHQVCYCTAPAHDPHEGKVPATLEVVRIASLIFAILDRVAFIKVLRDVADTSAKFERWEKCEI